MIMVFLFSILINFISLGNLVGLKFLVVFLVCVMFCYFIRLRNFLFLVIVILCDRKSGWVVVKFWLLCYVVMVVLIVILGFV